MELPELMKSVNEFDTFLDSHCNIDEDEIHSSRNSVLIAFEEWKKWSLISRTFTIDDIRDRKRLERMVDSEALPIFKSPNSSHGRALDDIRFSVRQGKVAELFLIENGLFKESKLKYHDVIDEHGDYVEVKAYNVPNSKIPYVEKDIHRYKNADWCKAKWYYLFQFTYGEYRLLEKIRI